MAFKSSFILKTIHIIKYFPLKLISINFNVNIKESSLLENGCTNINITKLICDAHYWVIKDVIIIN